MERASEAFRITYIGGGSRFVITLLHGLASKAEELKSLNRPIDLVLMDIDTNRASEMEHYARIVASQTGLNLRTSVTDNRDQSLEGADWIIFSVGAWGEIKEKQAGFRKLIGEGLHGETTPMVAIEAACYWPYMRQLSEDIHRLAPHTVFSTLVNPTDVIAGAMEQAFGIPSIGICVEVPQLIYYLAYYLQVEARDIALEHIGVNHVGWVSRWWVKGQDGAPILSERVEELMSRPDWNPHFDWHLKLFQATGYLRASPYHSWPYAYQFNEEQRRRHQVYIRAVGLPPEGLSGYRELHRKVFNRCIAEGKMIAELDPPEYSMENKLYTYPQTRHTLGAIALGLMGGTGEPVPLQAQNGDSNPSLPAGARLELPVSIEGGKFIPKRVDPIPRYLFGRTEMLIHQRKLLIEWLSGQDEKGLIRGLLAFPEHAPIERLLELAKKLPEEMG